MCAGGLIFLVQATPHLLPKAGDGYPVYSGVERL